MKFMKIVVVATGAIIAGTALTNEVSHAAESTEFQRYHAAITAAERCRSLSFDQQDHNRLAERIRELVGEAPRDSLTQISQARSMMERSTQFRPRCENEDVQQALDRFDRDLRTALR